MNRTQDLQRYRETDIATMSGQKVIVMLYEKLVSDLEEALAACDRNDQLAVTQRVNHSQRIVSELRNALDHDIGGEISAQLESLYDFLFHEHLAVLVDRDPRHIHDCLAVVAPLLDAWRRLPANEEPVPARQPGADPASPARPPAETGAAPPATRQGLLCVSA